MVSGIPQTGGSSQTHNLQQTRITEKSPSIFMKKAFEAGSRTSDDLVGYTTSAEQYRIKQTIENEVTADNVMSFLNGYEHNKLNGKVFGIIPTYASTTADTFFEQMRSESGFKEKQDLMKNVGGKLQQYLQNKGYTDEAAQIAEILQHDTLNKADCKVLDKLVQDANKYGY